MKSGTSYLDQNRKTRSSQSKISIHKVNKVTTSTSKKCINLTKCFTSKNATSETTEEVRRPKYFIDENPTISNSPLPLPQVELYETLFPFNIHGDQVNLEDEFFFRNTDRKGAQLLLFDLEDGAFLLRPSKKFFLILSLVYNSRCLNLVVQKTETNKIRLGIDDDTMSPEFETINALINYFSRKQLKFQYQGTVIETCLRTILPPHRC